MSLPPMDVPLHPVLSPANKATVCERASNGLGHPPSAPGVPDVLAVHDPGSVLPIVDHVDPDAREVDGEEVKSGWDETVMCNVEIV